MSDFNTGATNPNGPGSKINPIVVESDFNYEMPEGADDNSLRDAEKDFLSQIAEEYTPEFDAEEQPEVPEGDVIQQEIEAEVQEESEDPKYARGIERVVAREMAAREREQAAEARIKAAEAREAELKKYEGLKPAAELAEQFDLDPVGAFKSMGKDPDTMIKLALAQQLGDKAPAELKEFARKATDDLRYKRLEAKLAAKEQNERAAAYFNTIQAGAREYVTGFDKELDPKKPGKKVGDSTPTLALVAKADPDYARDEIMEEIVTDSRRRAAEDPNGEPISYSEACSRVEARLSKLAKLLTPQMNAQATKNGQRPNGTKPIAPPSTKPAAKPLAPWARKTSSLEEDGIQEAIREYHRVEAERKRR